MKTTGRCWWDRWAAALVIVCGLAASAVNVVGAELVTPVKSTQPALWITAYYPGWTQGTLPPREIDFQEVTHLVQFSVKPRIDGSLDWTKHDLDGKIIKETVRLTHAAGRKILLCIGSADTAANFRWDDVAQVPYLSVPAVADAHGKTKAFFITYDDERSLTLKIDYARKTKLGGAIIWEIASGYRPELPAGKRDPLLQAVKRAAALNGSDKR